MLALIWAEISPIEKILKNDRYLIKDVDGFQLSRNPYQGVWSVNNIRHWMKNSSIV